MGRKEGGSLFHQAINMPGLMTLANRTDADGKSMEVSFQTRGNYYNWLKIGMEYFKAMGIRRFTDITVEMAQQYADHLTDQGKSPSTVHSYLAPLCKAMGISMAEITLPVRRASGFTRSRGKGKKHGGRPEELNAMLGLRENDLIRLRGNGLIEKKGVLYVVVDKGKGGKYQEQKVLPKYEEAVKKWFDGSDRKLFAKKDFVNGFDYHAQRRAIAWEALQYYMAQVAADPGYRKKLYDELAGQWHANNKKYRDKLEPFPYFSSPYKLRGENCKLAEKQGLPTELDRLLLRAVSIQHLAHWRDKVTVQSYYFSR